MSAERHVRSRAQRLGGEAALARGILELRTATSEQVSIPLPDDWERCLTSGTPFQAVPAATSASCCSQRPSRTPHRPSAGDRTASCAKR